MSNLIDNLQQNNSMISIQEPCYSVSAFFGQKLYSSTGVLLIEWQSLGCLELFRVLFNVCSHSRNWMPRQETTEEWKILTEQQALFEDEGKEHPL